MVPARPLKKRRTIKRTNVTGLLCEVQDECETASQFCDVFDLIVQSLTLDSGPPFSMRAPQTKALFIIKSIHHIVPLSWTSPFQQGGHFQDLGKALNVPKNPITHTDIQIQSYEIHTESTWPCTPSYIGYLCLCIHCS